MKQMKTITVNGVTYEVSDPNAPVIDDQRVGSSIWSSKNTVDKLCPSFTESGTMVTCEPVETYPLEVVTEIELVQEGSGDPHPDNVRPFVCVSELVLDHSGKNFVPDTWRDLSNWIDGYIGLDLPPGKYCAWGEKTAPSYVWFQKSTDGGATWNTNFLTGRVNAYIVAGDGASTITFTVNEGDMIRLGCSQPYHSAVSWIQVEPGTNKTVRSQYYREKVFVDFGEAVYSGRYNWSTGILTLDKGIKIFDGTENWSKYTSHPVYFVAINDKRIGFGTSACNSFKNTKNKDAYDSATEQVGLYTDHNVNPTAYFDWGESSNTVDDWKAWLAERYANGLPVTLVYDLAVPIQIQLDPSDINAFPGTNVLYCKDGITVTGRADPGAIINKLTNAIVALGANI